ncbi:response regulator, partial [candidate division KSB1 bacterium]|nr:response regulator [candidate division KSB1 bacterium]
MASILVVDDDKNILLFLREILARMGHELTTADNGAKALEILEEKGFDLIVSDLQMPWVDGISVLKASKKKDPDTEVLILTGYGSIKSAVRAMKAGAFEYLSKPVDVDELRIKVNQALEHRDMKIEIERQKQELTEFNEMIARDLKLAEQVQDSLVPQPFENHRIGVGVKYMPMIGVGGDYADIYFDGLRTVYLTIVDVTGHGITAALLVNRVCNEVRKLIRDQLEPNQIITNLNNFIV